jgi:CRISPR/Cas system-associated exonuclease Cas4 (RecB family)
MPIPEDFQFSQASLQDYIDCRRRFQLRYLLELAWPAPAAEPADEYETHVRDGQAFHRLIHQHQLGLPAERLTAQAEVEAQAEGPGNLASWWNSYLSYPPENLPTLRYPEVTLSAPVGGHRLLAKYDLVAVDPGRRAVSVDWKTSQRRPTSAWLVARLQTRVYRYLLVRAGVHLNGGQPIAAEQVEMIYWFAAFPDRPERLRYDRTQHEADGRYLASLIAEIAGSADDDFPLTDDVQRCRFCPYRSLCGRGAEAGDMNAGDDDAGAAEEATADWTAGFDFEQVAEVEF